MKRENPIKIRKYNVTMENPLFSLLFVSSLLVVLLIATSSSSVEGQVLNLPPSFLSHNQQHNHHQQTKDHSITYSKQRHDSDGNNKNDDRKMSFSNKNVGESLQSLTKQTEERTNEPHEQPKPTVPTFCHVEISTKIPGNCITVGQLGRACVAGDYLDLFSVDCM